MGPPLQQAASDAPALASALRHCATLAAACVEARTLEGKNYLWLFNIAIERGPFIVDLPIKDGDVP
jgi:hypothetical protein